MMLRPLVTSLLLCVVLGLLAGTAYAAATMTPSPATVEATPAVFNYGTCQTPPPDKESGLCVRLGDCENLYGMIETKNAKYLRESQCGLDNIQSELTKRVLVCCPDKHTRKTSEITPRQVTPANVLPDPSVCGNVLSDKILGGTVTELDEFPWMVLLSYKKPNNSFGFHCGGALITSRYVITAGHCLLNPEMPTTWSLHSVRLGEWDTSTSPDCKPVAKGKPACAPPHIDVVIESTLVHELYLPNSIDQFHDVALLRLVKAVAFTDYIKPICLPVAESVRNSSFADTAMDVAGWGVTEKNEPSAQKLKILVKVWNLEKCQDKYRSYQVHINSSQLCAGGEENIDTCRGDSGGPLMVTERIGDRDIFFLAGIVSYGPKPCGLRGWPGVYTRVGYFTEWIQKNLKP